MKSYILGGLIVCVLLYFIFGIQWSDTRERIEGCFEPQTVALPDLFKEHKKPLWTKEEQAGVPPEDWNLPFLEGLIDPNSAEFLSNLGISGFLQSGVFESSTNLLTKETKVRLTGNVVIFRSGLFSEFVNQISAIPFIEVEVNGKNYIVHGTTLSINIKKLFKNSKCYESNHNI